MPASFLDSSCKCQSVRVYRAGAVLVRRRSLLARASKEVEVRSQNRVGLFLNDVAVVVSRFYWQ